MSITKHGAGGVAGNGSELVSAAGHDYGVRDAKVGRQRAGHRVSPSRAPGLRS
ncbi:MAG: hypothetical protein ACRDOI_08265 [Trebonia sp.]